VITIVVAVRAQVVYCIHCNKSLTIAKLAQGRSADLDHLRRLYTEARIDEFDTNLNVFAAGHQT
jgi:hypothetical protein